MRSTRSRFSGRASGKRREYFVYFRAFPGGMAVKMPAGCVLQDARNRPPKNYSISMTVAWPMPPAMHSVARPYFRPRRFISYISVTRMRQPEEPTG